MIFASPINLSNRLSAMAIEAIQNKGAKVPIFRISVFGHFLVSCVLTMGLLLQASHGWASEGDGIDPMKTQALPKWQPSKKIGPSGYPLPRFVSLKASRVNLRIGPGREHAIAYRYLKAGLPVEIVQEWSNWRQIRDWEGTEGWVHKSLLSGKRAAIVTPWSKGDQDLHTLTAKPGDTGRIVAQLEPGTSAEVSECLENWCSLEIAGRKGWIEQDKLWGVYEGEPIED